MKNKLGLIIGLLLLVASGISYYVWTKNKGSEVIYETATATTKDLRIEFGIDGEIIAETYQPKFLIAGRVKNVLVKEGDTVKQGQWLATLDVAESQKNLEKALRDYSKERNDFEEDVQVTYLDQNVSDTVKRVLEKNQWDLEKSVLDVEIKDLALAESRLKSPIAGVVARVDIKPGDVVSTQNQTEIVTIIKPGELIFEASAEETDILKIDDKQTIMITLDTYPKDSFVAKLLFVSPVAERDASGIVSYPVKAMITDTQDKKILDGMEGSVNFITKEVNNVVAVPNLAVYREGNESYVDVVSDKEVVKTAVVTGFTNGRDVEIKSGITKGSVVQLKK
jgi:RND family efflux transporter MFP subunit